MTVSGVRAMRDDSLMIRKLIAAALLALVLGPLVSFHLLGGVDLQASFSILRDGGSAVYIFEIRGGLRLEPLLAAAIL